MLWEKAKNYGVIKVDGKNVHVYESNIQKSTIQLNDEVKDARWAGDAIVVYFTNGKVRRYTSLIQYSNA